MRDIYGQMFRYHHRMPDEIGRQNPKVLFEMLDSLEENNEEIDYDELPEHLRMFYGR